MNSLLFQHHSFLPFRLFLCITAMLMSSSVSAKDLCKEQKDCYKVCETYEKDSLRACTDLCDRFECRTKQSGSQGDQWTVGKTQTKKDSDSWTINQNTSVSYDNPKHCVIVRSEACQDRCGKEKGTKEKLCRRECLSRMCRKANQLDVAEEANTPGILQCNVCKEENERICRRQCAQPIYIGNGSVPTDLTFSCNKICILTYCASECPFSLSTLF